MALDWDKLRIFHTVTEMGSFTHAGESLGISQSAVSRQIAALEDSLGVILFQRHARGLHLTEQGEMLYATTRDVFGKLAQIEGQMIDLRDKAEGALSLTMSEFIGVHWLAPHLARFHQNFPQIHLSLLLDDRIFNLGLREADVALRLSESDQPDLIQMKLSTVPFTLYAAPSYLERLGAPETTGDLPDGHTLIGFSATVPLPYPGANALFRLAGVDPAQGDPHLLTTNSVSASAALARGGYGIAALPLFMAGGDSGLVHVLPQAEIPPAQMYFVYPEVRRHSRRIELLRDFLLGLLDESPLDAPAN